MTSRTNPNPSSSSPKRKMAQGSSDRLSKIPKLKVPTSTPTDPSQPNHSRSRNRPQHISTADSKQHHIKPGHHPHHGFIHPPHDATLFSPGDTSSTPSQLQPEAPGVIPPFTSPTGPLPHSQTFSDQQTPSATEDAAGLGAPPNLASDLEEALMEEVERNPGLAEGLRIEDLAERGVGGSNLTPGELGTEIEIEVEVEVEVEDEITWESDEEEEDQEEEHHGVGEKDEEYLESSHSSASESGESLDSGYDDTFVARNPDIQMDTGPEYDEGFVEGGDNYNGVGVGAGDADAAGGGWNDMSNDVDGDPYAARSMKGTGENDVQMRFGGGYEEWDNGDAEWNGVEALEPAGDEAVDGYEGTGDGMLRHKEEDVWW